MKAEGIWECTVLGASFGEDDKGSPNVQINVQITDDNAPDGTKGQRCTYEDQVNTRSALYVGRSCKAVGWKGHDLNTLKADCKEWIDRTGGKSTIEIKHLEIKSGKKAGQIWDKPNAVGRGARVLKPASSERLSDANDAMRQAMEADGGGGGGYEDGPADEIPFVMSSMSADLMPSIAKVLR